MLLTFISCHHVIKKLNINITCIILKIGNLRPHIIILNVEQTINIVNIIIVPSC